MYIYVCVCECVDVFALQNIIKSLNQTLIISKIFLRHELA